MKLIIWLWNPWEKYLKTKHNIWFMFLDFLITQENFTEFKNESKFKWIVSKWVFEWENTILIKPQTYMNLSWESIIKIVNFYKIDLNNIIVIYDDLSMEFWKLRFRDKWSAWWHNGIKDIIKYFKNDFNRIKIWIWFNDNYEVSDWVLSDFKEDELLKLEKEIFPNVYNILKEKV